MIAVRLQPDARHAMGEFTATLSRHPEVLEVYFVAGATDFLVHVATASTDELRRFVGDVLNSDPAVAGTETNLIFEHTRARGRFG
jgi:DNA-binding Lrp family transcriptional regulator